MWASWEYGCMTPESNNCKSILCHKPKSENIFRMGAYFKYTKGVLETWSFINFHWSEVFIFKMETGIVKKQPRGQKDVVFVSWKLIAKGVWSLVGIASWGKSRPLSKYSPYLQALETYSYESTQKVAKKCSRVVPCSLGVFLFFQLRQSVAKVL